MVTELEGQPIFHLALASDWQSALAAGDYRISSLGRSLAEEGFLHACYRHQVDGVRARYYAEVTEPLLLLEIDPSLLDQPLVVETPEGADEGYPHIYGPLSVTAVVRTHPINPSLTFS